MLDGGSQPPPDIQLHPGQVRVVGHGPLDQVTRHGLKESFDVQIDDPIGPPAALPRRPDRIQRRPAGAIGIGVRVEVWFHQRLQDHRHDRLRHAVGHGRNAEGARAARCLRYLDEPHGRRMVRSRRHPVPDLVEIVLQVRLECRQ